MSDLLLSISSSADRGGVVWRDSASLPCRREHDRPSVTRWRLCKIAHSAFHAKQQLGQLGNVNLDPSAPHRARTHLGSLLTSGVIENRHLWGNGARTRSPYLSRRGRSQFSLMSD